MDQLTHYTAGVKFSDGSEYLVALNRLDVAEVDDGIIQLLTYPVFDIER